MNKELMRKMIEEIEAHPEKHDQTGWALKTSCGTTLCMAGWACMLSGWEPVWVNPPDEMTPFAQKNGEEVRIPEKATELLGLEDWQASELFYAPEHIALNLLKEWSA